MLGRFEVTGEESQHEANGAGLLFPSGPVHRIEGHGFQIEPAEVVPLDLRIEMRGGLIFRVGSQNQIELLESGGRLRGRGYNRTY
jgi:hypothetical protein